MQIKQFKFSQALLIICEIIKFSLIIDPSLISTIYIK